LRKTIIYDDIDGTEGAAEVTFTLSGITYTADLVPANEKLLREAVTLVERVLNAAHEPEPEPARRGDSEDARIREWARVTGRMDVAPKGRISQAVRDLYRASLNEAETEDQLWSA